MEPTRRIALEKVELVSIGISREAWKAVKMVAAYRETTIREIIEQAITEKFGKEKVRKT